MRDCCDGFLSYGLMLIESRAGRGRCVKKADPVEAVMQQDFRWHHAALPVFFRDNEAIRGFSSFFAFLLSGGSLQSEGKSFELETVTPPLRLIDFLTFTGHVSHIHILTGT